MTAEKVHIVGAGLVGPLMAIYLARKGLSVALHERRSDLRKSRISAGRSINLALTARMHPSSRASAGESVQLHIRPHNCVVLSASGSD